jgi:hypothetical protein
MATTMVTAGAAAAATTTMVQHLQQQLWQWQQQQQQPPPLFSLSEYEPQLLFSSISPPLPYYILNLASGILFVHRFY